MGQLQVGIYDMMGVLVTVVVHFFREPGLLLLLGAGVMGLGLLGVRRMSS